MKDNKAFWVSLVSLLFSGAALYVAASQAYYTRKHDSLMVRPLLDFAYQPDDIDPTVGISVENVGLGPARISTVKYFVDRVPMKDWDEVIDRGKLKSDLIATWELDKSDTLKVGEAVWLISRDTRNKAELKKFADFVNDHVAVQIVYCSLDNECRTECSWEGRC